MIFCLLPAATNMPIPRFLYKMPSSTNRFSPLAAVAGLMLNAFASSLVLGACSSSKSRSRTMLSSSMAAICR